MARKVYSYRGKSLEEIKAMGLSDFAKLLPARQRRTVNRGFTEPQKRLIEQVKKFKDGKKKKPVKTHCRNMVVIPEFLDVIIHIHRGKTFVPILIRPEMLGHYLGEFAATRSKVAHNSPGVGATRSSSAISVK